MTNFVIATAAANTTVSNLFEVVIASADAELALVESGIQIELDWLAEQPFGTGFGVAEYERNLQIKIVREIRTWLKIDVQQAYKLAEHYAQESEHMPEIKGTALACQSLMEKYFIS